MLKKVILMVSLGLLSYSINAMHKLDITVQNNLTQEIDKILKEPVPFSTAIKSIKSLEYINQSYIPFFDDYNYMQRVFQKLMKRYSLMTDTFETEWKKVKIEPAEKYEGTYLNKLPRELRVELGKYTNVDGLVQEINKIDEQLSKARGSKEYEPLIFRLKRLRDKNLGLFDTAKVKQMLVNLLKHVHLGGIDVQLFIRYFNLENELTKEKSLECDLLKEIIANNLDKVKNLIEEKNVSPLAQLLSYEPNNYNYCQLKNYLRGCGTDPMCYAKITRNEALINYLNKAQK